VVGEDRATYDHFINWTRFVVQERRRAQTAWLFNGVQGTGKGLLANRILRPLIGATNSAFFDASVLEDKFNDSLETSLLTFIDELTIGDLEDSSKIMSSLKSRITEPTITIRKMRTSPYEATNRNNFILFSNSKEQIAIEASDRRYNVGMYQHTKLSITDNEVNVLLEAELEDFAVWLLATKADEVKARNIIHNQARADMQEVSLNSIDTIAKHLLDGNLEELYEMRVNQSQVSGSLLETAFRYNQLLDDIIFHDITKLQREQVILFFQHGAGVDVNSPIKVTKFLAHHGIHIKPVRVNNAVVKGFSVEWKYDQQWFDDRKAELIAKRTPKTQADQA
jgi:phage/plasmid-associated DNA primase